MPHNKQKRDDHLTGGSQLQGWPGHRTRQNRSGLDPLDTQAEAAHMEGTFLRNMFTLKARTRNPFYLILMFVFGIIPFLILAFLIISETIRGNPSILLSLIYPAVIMVITGVVTINFLFSILEILGFMPSRKSIKSAQTKAQVREKKLSKRRKDFR